MKTKQMLYIMGIDWDWIYQRPQIFADKLSQDFHLTVIFPRSILKKNKKLPCKSEIEFGILWTLPYQEKNKVIAKISACINAKLFKSLNRYQYIFIGYPLYARYIPDNYQGKIIYDCMDNHEYLYPDQKRVSNILGQEINLAKKSNLLVASSAFLQKKMDSIVGYPKSILIRNGTISYNTHDVTPPTLKARYILGYIGTVSNWFDFSLINNSLNTIPNIEYHLIGPITVKKTFADRIIYHSAVPHELLWDSVQKYDCLIMPFIVNDIVSSVDPVKLYEYIAFGKCIISVYYPEIAWLKDFVYFYENEHEYINLLLGLMENGFLPKYNRMQQLEFLSTNSWDTRYELLKTVILHNIGEGIQ